MGCNVWKRGREEKDDGLPSHKVKMNVILKVCNCVIDYSYA